MTAGMTALRGRLVRHGWQPWSRVVQHLVGAHCLWLDVDGLQRGAASASFPPGGTHLWAWADRRLFRARLDIGSAVLTELELEPITSQDICEVRRWLSPTWPPGEGRIAGASGREAWTGKEAEVFEVRRHGGEPIIFFRFQDGTPNPG